MRTSDIDDPLFLEAVLAIDSGNIARLEQLIQAHPELIKKRLLTPNEEGYFKDPYLMWFIADNPIRNHKLPENIMEVTRLLIKSARQFANDSYQKQVNYTFSLVETGRIPRECGVQNDLLDLLMENGVIPGDVHGALTHGNLEAAKHILKRGGKMTLAAAVCLDRADDINELQPGANQDDKQVALMAAAFYGQADKVKMLLKSGANPNGYVDHGFHTHATFLHQAVSSGSLDTVKRLLDAGASRDATDKTYGGTPLGWAMYMQTEETDEEKKENYRTIENYLRARIDK
ncbi:MAG TPA: ankyrin repeat domain-containing protein [Puia sp.]|nr:ankyrin repeat domain-containing protein [Puia sp.]